MHVDVSKKSSNSSLNIPQVVKNAAKSPSGNDMQHEHRSMKHLESKPAHTKEHSPGKRGT